MPFYRKFNPRRVHVGRRRRSGRSRPAAGASFPPLGEFRPAAARAARPGRRWRRRAASETDCPRAVGPGHRPARLASASGAGPSRGPAARGGMGWAEAIAGNRSLPSRGRGKEHLKVSITARSTDRLIGEAHIGKRRGGIRPVRRSGGEAQLSSSAALKDINTRVITPLTESQIRAGPEGLCGRRRRPAEWTACAQRNGCGKGDDPVGSASPKGRDGKATLQLRLSQREGPPSPPPSGRLG
jgi:hypothetical protein